jgi:hypothetical protein
MPRELQERWLRVLCEYRFRKNDLARVAALISLFGIVYLSGNHQHFEDPFDMTPRIISAIATLAFVFISSADAQFLAMDMASGDSRQDLAKRFSGLKNETMTSSILSAEEQGWNLYRYEVVGDFASGVLEQQTTSGDRAGIAGSIVVRVGNEWRVRFYSVRDKSVKPVADVVVDEDFNAQVATKSLVDFSADELAMIRARMLIDARKDDPCQSTYKLIVVPASSGGNIFVYQIRQVFDETHFPEGQHIRYEISSDGSQILSQRDFSRRCNVLPVQKGSDNVSNEVKLTNTMDQQPTEMHVYLSLRYNSNIFLGTMQSNLYWWIKSGVVTTD